ncbi:ABC transporter permease subunit [Streptomyces sp. TLI_185]|uniref:ABC transporter permease subunit n=1 Tax=Streptomyces sp. TLI_185 TaxID=2485151 RepID=UPI000F4DD5CA|nr:ABC transporter permease subunit [Streptomyces sp. TLI_185]RPF34487.1 ABC-2 family transporter [Streptomyces sp. TLI_185]
MTWIKSAVAFEWTKVRTLRPLLWSLVCYAALSVAVGLLTGVFVGRTYTHKSELSTFDPISTGYSGLRLGMIALVVFGVLIVSSEYSSGTIRNSLAAVPRRGVFYGAKMITGGAAALVFSLVAVVAGFFGTQATMGARLSVSLTDEGVLRSLFGAVLYTTLLCLFCMGLASVLRSSALTMGILVPLFFTVSTILSNIPGVERVAQFLPDVAGGLVLYRDVPGNTVLNAWTGLGVLALWTVASVAVGYWAVRRRDA